jgi:hypothetical protein
MIGKGVLPFPRFPMIENLLGIRLAYINKGEAIEVELKDF